MVLRLLKMRFDLNILMDIKIYKFHLESNTIKPVGLNNTFAPNCLPDMSVDMR